MSEARTTEPEAAGATPAVPWWLSTRRHLLAVLMLTLALPLSALAWWVDGRARAALMAQARFANATTATLASRTVQEHFVGLSRFVASIEARPMFRDAAGRRDAAAARRHLADLVALNPMFDRAFVTDLGGTEWADSTDDREALGRNYADRDWYRGVSRAGAPYVSEAYLRQGRPRMRIVAVTTPVRGDDGRAVGYLVAQHPIATLTAWMAEARPSAAGGLVLVDRRGVLLVRGEATDPPASPGGRPLPDAGEAAAVAGDDPLTGEPSLLSFRPVPALGGGVLASQPTAAVLAPASALRRTIAASAVGCFAAMLGLGTAWVVAIRRAHGALGERNAQLSRSNVELARLAADLEVTTASVRRAHGELQQAHEELKRAEGQLVQAEKLSALGQMVAGVAHEINNPLAYVVNNVVVLQRDVGYLRDLIALYAQAENTLAAHQRDLLGRIRAHAEEIDLPYVLNNLPDVMARSREGLGRIQQIVKDLRDFARLDRAELAETDLNREVALTLSILGHEAQRRGIALHTDFAPLPPLTCYPAKINQVVLNLLSNAVDACAEGGAVTLRTRPRPDGGVALEVADDGAGIDPAILGKVFDPFFTTKPVGKGTGLGLSISYGIVRAHGGTIEVESQPGRGTRFLVSLPPHPPALGPADHPAPAAAARPLACDL